MKLLLIFILSALTVLTYGQINSKTQNQITGTWTNSEFGYQMTLILDADGGGEFEGEAIRYIAQGDKLTVTQQGVTTTYNLILAPTTLKLSGGDLDQAITFLRQGTTTSPAENNTRSSSSIPRNLLGVWSGYNETIEFKGNDQCIYRGQPFTCSVSSSQITLYTSQGNLAVGYSVAGNELSLVVNGQNFIYKKNGSAVSQNNSPNKSQGGKIDQSLVGRWCYVNVNSTNNGGSSTSECITLRGDGTYEYFSETSRSVNSNTVVGGTSSQGNDRGTWWVQGGRIYYNSKSQGQGSYQLVKQNHPKTNDPMIVLEGRAYVTQTIKQSW